MSGIMPHQEGHVRCGMRWKQPFFAPHIPESHLFSSRNILLAEGQPKNQKQARTPQYSRSGSHAKTNLHLVLCLSVEWLLQFESKSR